MMIKNKTAKSLMSVITDSNESRSTPPTGSEAGCRSLAWSTVN